jgi:hypothetical protein
MTLVSDEILESGVTPRAAMENYIGEHIWTYHTGRVLEYRIIGITTLPLRCMMVERDSMTDFYRFKHGIELKNLDWPCFYTENSNVIPPELAFLDEDDTVDLMQE